MTSAGRGGLAEPRGVPATRGSSRRSGPASPRRRSGRDRSLAATAHHDRRSDEHIAELILTAVTDQPQPDIAAGYGADATLQELATQLGMHRDTISAALKRACIERRYHQTVAVDGEQAAELLAAGLTITETAEALGIGRTTLVKARRRARS